MAELKSLTLGGTKYDSFPARPYWVDVTITGSATDGTYSTAATAADVLAAIEAGLTPVVRATGTGDTEAYYVLALVIYEAPSTGKRIYQFTRSNLVMALKEQANGSFEVTNPYEATDEVTTLPNPYKLTFTGAVEAEYDGSEAVSVEIPEGGVVDDWKMIADITTEEEISNVFITQDSDGNTFALTDFIVYVKALANEAGTTSGYFRFGMNPNNAQNYLFQPSGGVPGSGFRWYQVRFTLLGDLWYPTDMIGQANAAFGFAGGYIKGLNDPYSITTPAAAVVVNFMANVGVGTRIMVYGK